MKLKRISIKKINYTYTSKLVKLLLGSQQKYSQYFIPFDFNYKTIFSVLKKAKSDQYFGIFIEDQLIGFYMLRGFDEGYKIPAYGVWISQRYSRLSFAKLTLSHAFSFCKLNKINQIMLKVHPDNIHAKRIYENYGFIKTGIDSKKYYIYIKNL